MKPENMVQTYAPDRKKLAELVLRAKGSDRTMAQFAGDTGISAPTLSRIANGKINNPLSQEFLKKIYEHRCDEADFSMDVLLLANGMVDPNAVKRGKDYIERYTSRQERGIALERHAKNAIMNAVIDRGYIVQNIPADFDNRRNQSPFGIRLPYDFNLFVPSEEQQLWYFEVINGGMKHFSIGSNTFAHAMRLFLVDAWCPEFMQNQKTSYVFENRILYEQFIKRFRGAPIKTAVSAILINASTEEVLEETWISVTPEAPSIFTKEPVGNGGIAVWEEEEFEDKL